MEKFIPQDYADFLARYKMDVPANFNFAFDVVDRIAETEPDRPAMVHIDETGKQRDFNMRFFSEESLKVAAGLAASGLRRGDRVMLVLFRRVEFWTVMLALQRLGAVAIPTPGMLTAKDVEYRFTAAEIVAVIAEHTVAETIDAAQACYPAIKLRVGVDGVSPRAGWIGYKDMVQKGAAQATRVMRQAGGNDPLVIYFSSGTTGNPKMIEHDHTYPLAHFVTAAYWHDLRPGDLHLTIADTGWAKAMWGKFYGQWMAGAAVFTFDFRNAFNAKRLLHAMETHRVTTFCAPPTVYRLLIQQPLKNYNLSALRHCVSAGELLNKDIFDIWKEATGLLIREGYGQTETVLQAGTFPFMAPKPGSMGRPCPGWDLVLLDDDLKPVPQGEEGEICIRMNGRRPLGMFTQYVKDDELNQFVMRNGVYHTGDKAWMDEDGYLWFIGRNDDLIKSAGYRIGPFEVESVLVTHPAVAEAAVTGLPDAARGQIVKATVVLKKDYTASEHLVHELQEHVRKNTATYKYPRVVEFVDALPKTISGKIRRAEIRKRDAEKKSF